MNRHGRADRHLIAPRDSIAAMEGYFSPQLEVDVRLNTNEAPEPPPPGFTEAVLAELDAIELNRYPDREAVALREAIGELHGVEAERVFPANGSNEVIQSLLLAYGGPGRSAVVFEPTYALHSHIPHVTGTRVVSGERDERYDIPLSEVDRVLDEVAAIDPGGPAVVFLCSPNNPTGRVEAEEVIAAVLERAPGLVVVDEAYGQFAPRSALEAFGGLDNLVVVRTFSKTWSLASLRLGYAIAHPEVVDACFRVSLPYHLDAFKQVAGRIALRFVGEMHDRVTRLIAERERLLEALPRVGATVSPSQANFILFRVEEQSSTAVWKGLVERSVIVRDLSSYARMAGWLRVTVGTPEENDAFLAALEAVIATN